MVKQSNRFSLRGMVTKRLGVLLITLTLLIVPIVFYYTFYISNRTSYLTNRDFRQLASISVQVEDRIDQLKGLFVKTVKRAITEKASQKKDSKDDSQLSPEELFKQRLGKNLEVVTVPKAVRSLNQDDVEKLTKNLDSEITIKPVTGGETSTLYFIWPGSHEFPDGAQAKTGLDEIVTSFIGKRNLESRKGSEHNEGFDAILIASTERKKNQSGETSVSSKIIFQQGTPDLDIDSLDNLANADVSGKTIDVRTLTENSTSADVRLAGTTYKIYSQPIEIPLATSSSETANRSSKDGSSGDAETSWVVCGLVQTSHFQHEAWAFPYTWLITFVFGTVVIILSWPFLKLLFIGPKDRLRMADFYWIGFSLLVGAAMLTFFLLYAVSYTRSETVLDRQLQQTSLEINARFQEEVALILRELSALKAAGSADLKQIEIGKIRDNKWHELPPVDGHKYPDDVRTEILKDKEFQPDKALGVYPYFRSALWMKQDGERRLEWTTYSSPLTPVSLTDRDYFKKILEGSSRHNKVYEQLFSPGSAQYDFWLEPTISRLTTEKVVVVSSSIRDETQDKNKVSMILLGDPAMMSLMRTIVPSGFGYRVIDSSGRDPSDDKRDDPGKVLFQSSESQQSMENFFQECDNNHSLRSLIFGHVADFVDVNYKGESHRVFVRPLDGFPNWSLIVFRNKQPLRTVFLQILTTAGFLFFIYAILLLLPLTIAYIFRIRKDNRTEWIWPTPLKADVYRKTGYAYWLLCALSLAIMLGLLRFLGIDADRWTPMVLVSLIAFTGVLVLALRPKLDWPLGKLHSIVNTLKLNRLLDHGTSYVWNTVTLLVLLGVLPAITFYKVAYNEQMKLFAKCAQFNLAQELEERYERVKRQYSTNSMDSHSNPSPFGNNIIAQRVTDERDVYTDFWTQRLRPDQSSSRTTIPDPGLDGRMTFLTRFSPWFATWFNETSVEMGGLTPGKAADGSWESRIPVDKNNLWRRQLPSDDNIILQSRPQGVIDIDISTQLERFGRKWQFAWLWMAVGFLIIISVLFWVTRFVVRRVFLLDLTESPYLPTRSTDEIKENVFLVQTSPFATLNGATNGHTNSPPCYIDFATEASRDEWVKRLEAKAVGAETPSAVVLDHFEFRMNDRAHNDQKLRLLKTLLAAKKSVLIKSSHLPSTFSFTGAARDALKRHPNESSDSWAEIMTRFRRVYEPHSNEKILQDAITRLSNSLEHPSISKQRKDRALRLAGLIKHECAGAAWLANIGKEFIESLAMEEVESNYIFGQLMDRVELSYRKLWNNCSNDEKLTLLHLAEDRLLSYRDPDIRHLIQRGLIVCAPDIRLMNETFRAFVLSQCFLDIDESTEIQSAETKARKASSLTSFQIPVLIGFVGIVVFLVLTQKDLFSSPLTLVTAATTSIPTVFKVLSLFQGGNPGQKIFNA